MAAPSRSLQPVETGPVVPVGRLVNKADFERLLSTRSWARSAHFSIHHVATASSAGVNVNPDAESSKLSTELSGGSAVNVDNSIAGCWLGCIVPKRHARRAVTRNCLRRQMRAAFERRSASLPAGLWLVRLREGFVRRQFVSAASAALVQCARAELDALLTRRHR